MAAGKKNNDGGLLHVVMVPWAGFGHMMPFFHLSVAMARRGVRVSYISTPRNISRLPNLPSDVVSSIDLVALPKPHVDPTLLPEDAEATVDIPLDKIQYLKLCYDLLLTQPPFKDFITQASPDWLIVDLFSHQAVHVARECNVHVACFSAFSAASMVFLGPPENLLGDGGPKRMRPTVESLTVSPPWVDFESTAGLARHVAAGFHTWFSEKNASGVSDAERFGTVLQASQLMAIRSTPEFEGRYFDTLAKIIHRPLIPVGILPPAPAKAITADHTTDETTNDQQQQQEISSWFQWLDTQKPRSVVFVGFGSECKLTKEQVHEIAKGLELSNLPFLWALRKPLWAHHEHEALPEGFLDRTGSKGIVCWGWVPQMEILGHRSVGGSLFHSGWGSGIEALQFGHCLVLLPMIGDQMLNSRLFVERGVGVEVDRGGEDGSFSGESVAECLRLAMVSEQGKEVRVKAMEAAEVINDEKMHMDYVDKFVQHLMDIPLNKDVA